MNTREWRDQGHLDFLLHLTIDAFYDVHHGRRESDRAAYETGWRCERDEQRARAEKKSAEVRRENELRGR